MSIRLQLRRGTTTENAAFTGAQGELTYNTETHSLKVHDGTTVGGYGLPVLVAVQRPTAENGYTWYRKWSDGWVEQGARLNDITAGQNANIEITLPIPMSDSNYTANATALLAGAGDYTVVFSVNKSLTTATKLTVVKHWANTTASLNSLSWEVKGYAA